MNIVFRTDASLTIGSGHVMRCLTLALFLREKGCDCKFVSRQHEGNLIHKVSSHGFEVCLMNNSYIEPSTQENWQNDALQTIESINSEPVDWLIVDHYELDKSWESALRPFVRQIFVIDDLADRKHDCDLLLDQNIVSNYEKRYQTLVSDSCITLLGPRFALLQESFLQLIPDTVPRVGRIKKILIFFGGSDRYNLTGLTIEAFQRLDRNDIKLEVVIDFSSRHIDLLRNQIDGYEGITLHNTLPSLAPLMKQADLAIGAAGTTSWERCCLGLPALIVTIAENQKSVATELDRLGLAQYIGHYDSVSCESLSFAIDACLQSKMFEGWSRACMDSVDGMGTSRVCDLLAKQHKPVA